MSEMSSLVFDSISDAVFVINIDNYTIVAANRAALEQLKMVESEVVGRTCYEVTHQRSSPCKPPDHPCPIREMKETGSSVIVTHTHLDKDGNPRYYEIQAHPIKDDKENLVQMVYVSKCITARKEAEEKYRTVLDASMDAVFVLDKTKYLYVNRGAAELLGFSDPQELIGRDAFEFVASEDREMVRSMAIARQNGEELPSRYDFKLVRRDGTKIDVEALASVIEYEGKPVLLAVNRDITERKRMEEQLRESEERLHSFMDSATDAFVLFDSELNMVEVNKNALGMWRLSKEDAKGKNILEISPDLKGTGRYDKYLEVMKTGKPYFVDDFIPHPKFGDIHLSYKVFKVGDGIGFIVSDITGRKRIEEELRESERRYYELFESINDAVIVYGLQGKFLECNEITLQRLGYSREEFFSLRAVDLVHPDFHLLMNDTQKRILAGESTVVRASLAVRCKDGRVIPVEVNAHRIEYLGEPAILAVIRDITERKRMEEELKKYVENLEFLVGEQTKDLRAREKLLRAQNIRLQRLDEMKSRFISTATHELRTPLVSIKGYLELIRSGRIGEVPEKIDNLLKIVERNTTRLSDLTEDLLDQQRIESGRLEINPETIRLQDIVKEIVYEFESYLSKKGQVLDIQIPDALPPVWADRARIGEVLLNLLNNASKFSPPEAPISLRVREVGDFIEVQVSDRGIGVREEDLSKLFEPFPDVETPSFYGGTGLGLSICKGIIDLHGGRIWAESQGEGGGSTFTFTLPKQAEATDI